ncbi:MAG TPA: endonuclease/exonuclease/phosphatase family protein, partial [Phycisphaerae bacterium]
MLRRAFSIVCFALLLRPALADPAPVEITWQEAPQHIGQRCTVTGRVVAARTVRNRCFLNFHQDFRKHVSVVIGREAFAKFPEPPERMYADKQIAVTGTITEFQGRPEILVTGPEQIRILPETQAPATQPDGTAGSQLAATQPTSAPAPSIGRVRIATLNSLNLFDAYDDPYHSDESTPTKPRSELEHLAATIRALDADVLAMQEVENRGILEQFVRTFLPEMHYGEVVLFEGNDERGIDVAILSRFPVGPVTSYRHLKFPRPDGTLASFQRDLLRARIDPPGGEAFDMFVVHLKSKRGSRAGAPTGDPTLNVRLAEALEIRKIFDELLAADPAANFLICGDFNDTFDSQPVRTIVGSGPTALRSFIDELPPEQRVTYNKEPHRAMIDFILCSPALGARYAKGSYHITAGTVETNGTDH